MAEKPRAQYRVEFVRRVVEYVSFQRGQERLQEEEHDHAATDNHQRRHAVVADNLVDYNLRHEREDYAHELQEKHCDQHFKERFLVV